jgi:signal peptidase II
MTEPPIPATPATATPSEPPVAAPEPSAPLPGEELALAPEPAAEAPAVAPTAVVAPAQHRPSFVFFGLVSAIALLLDIGTKAWAEIRLIPKPFEDPSIEVIPHHLTLTLAYNKGGAWGLLQDQPETLRMPFFLCVSVLAILFIVSLYGKLNPGQRALTWGLPLVLGGALGNLSDRITRSSVIDFIDYRADWVMSMNRTLAKLLGDWSLTDHWPTFNVADIAICIGVGLMGVDMFTSRRGAEHHPGQPAVAGASQPPGA